MTIGMITEGITDQLVIDTIIHTVINHDAEKAMTTALCPMDDEPSGWTKVFTYIQSGTFRDGFDDKDFYTVIHLDTDTRADWQDMFKAREDIAALLKQIPVVSGSHKDRVPEIIEAIEKLIRGVIGPDFYDVHKDRIILAIAVNEMECWVLPFHASKRSESEKIVNCLVTLNQILNARFQYTIAANGKAKFYRRAIKDMSDRKYLLQKHHHNESLKIFVERLLAFAPL